MVLVDRTVESRAPDPMLLELPARELADLYHKLESLPVIEQAKGILMGHYGVDAETAFRILTCWSQTGNGTIRFSAETLTASVHSKPATEPPPYEIIDQILDHDRLLGGER